MTRFKASRVHDQETHKLRLYRLNYLPDYGFSPLVADSYGRLGDMTLRFFHRVSEFVAHRDGGPSASPSRYQQALFHRLCSNFQSSCFIATAQRITRGEYLDRMRVVGAPGSANLSLAPASLDAPASSSPPQPSSPPEHLHFVLFDGDTLSPDSYMSLSSGAQAPTSALVCS